MQHPLCLPAPLGSLKELPREQSPRPACWRRASLRPHPGAESGPRVPAQASQTLMTLFGNSYSSPLPPRSPRRMTSALACPQGPPQRLPLHTPSLNRSRECSSGPSIPRGGGTGQTAGTHTSSPPGGCGDIIFIPSRTSSLSACSVPSTVLDMGTQDRVPSPDIQQCGGGNTCPHLILREGRVRGKPNWSSSRCGRAEWERLTPAEPSGQLVQRRPHNTGTISFYFVFAFG